MTRMRPKRALALVLAHLILNDEDITVGNLSTTHGRDRATNLVVYAANHNFIRFTGYTTAPSGYRAATWRGTAAGVSWARFLLAKRQKS